MVVMYMTTLINAKLKYTLDFYEFMLTSRKELPVKPISVIQIVNYRYK